MLSERIAPWKGWLATFVVDAEGNYIGPDGTAKSLGNPLDLQLLIALRTACDVIVTTGATARAEQYRATRLAPILFLTRNPDSLIDLPAFESPGVHPNYLLDGENHENVFSESNSFLENRGFKSFLYEGGAVSLRDLLAQIGEIRLVVNVANQAAPEQVDIHLVLKTLLPKVGSSIVLDDVVIDQNRVTTWLITA